MRHRWLWTSWLARTRLHRDVMGFGPTWRLSERFRDVITQALGTARQVRLEKFPAMAVVYRLSKILDTRLLHYLHYAVNTY